MEIVEINQEKMRQAINEERYLNEIKALQDELDEIKGRNFEIEFCAYVDEDGDICKSYNGEVLIERGSYIKQRYIPKETELKVYVEKKDD